MDLLEGVLIDLLKTKWNTFVKAKFYRQFYFFFCYFLVSLFAFGLRPRAYGELEEENVTRNATNKVEINVTEAASAAHVKSLILHNLTEIICNYSGYHEALTQHELGTTNITMDNSTMPIDDSDEWVSFSECPLLDISSLENRVSF